MYWQAKDIEVLATEVIREFEDLNHLDDPRCRIAYQHCDAEKKKNKRVVFADTQLVNEKLKVFCPYDFLITVYDGSCAYLDEEHIKRLIYHELKHVGFEPGDGDEDKYFIVHHDLEDFRDVIDKWGIDWIRDDEERA